MSCPAYLSLQPGLRTIGLGKETDKKQIKAKQSYKVRGLPPGCDRGTERNIQNLLTGMGDGE